MTSYYRGMLIGDLARESGFSRDTIRYYEKLGLVVGSDRRENGYKEYSDDAVQRLFYVRTLKEYGFSLNEIRTLLDSLQLPETCDGIPEVLEEKLDDVEHQIEQLVEYRARLSRALADCRGEACEGVSASYSSASSRR